MSKQNTLAACFTVKTASDLILQCNKNVLPNEVASPGPGHNRMLI